MACSSPLTTRSSFVCVDVWGREGGSDCTREFKSITNKKDNWERCNSQDTENGHWASWKKVRTPRGVRGKLLCVVPVGPEQLAVLVFCKPSPMDSLTEITNYKYYLRTCAVPSREAAQNLSPRWLRSSSSYPPGAASGSTAYPRQSRGLCSLWQPPLSGLQATALLRLYAARTFSEWSLMAVLCCDYMGSVICPHRIQGFPWHHTASQPLHGIAGAGIMISSLVISSRYYPYFTGGKSEAQFSSSSHTYWAGTHWHPRES